MFELYCSVKGVRVLRWSSHVLHVAHPSPGVIDMVVRCACGELALLRTGKARHGRDRVVHGIGERAAAA